MGEVDYKAYTLDSAPFKQGVFERSTLFKPI